MVEKDYTDINVITPMKMFSRKIDEIVRKYGKLHKPFDEPCARLEFRDKLDEAERESIRRNGFLKVEEIKIEVGNLDKYADADRFILYGDKEDVQDRVIEGSRTQVIIGHTLLYRCKKRGHGISVFVPIGEYNSMKKEKVKGE